MWSHKYTLCRHLHYYMVFALRHERGKPGHYLCSLGDDEGSSECHPHVVVFALPKYYLLGQTWNHAWIRSNRKIPFILFPGAVSKGWPVKQGPQIRFASKLNDNGNRTILLRALIWRATALRDFFLAEPHLTWTRVASSCDSAFSHFVCYSLLLYIFILM